MEVKQLYSTTTPYIADRTFHQRQTNLINQRHNREKDTREVLPQSFTSTISKTMPAPSPQLQQQQNRLMGAKDLTRSTSEHRW